MADTFESERYEALAVVGTGVMGTVHRCLDRDTGNTVAIKLHGRQRPGEHVDEHVDE